jgi:hypothetical protein
VTRKNSPVIIPKTQLGAMLEEAAAIKRDLTKLLAQLETEVTGQKVTKPGGWRHDPLGWFTKKDSKNG